MKINEGKKVTAKDLEDLVTDGFRIANVGGSWAQGGSGTSYIKVSDRAAGVIGYMHDYDGRYGKGYAVYKPASGFTVVYYYVKNE